MRRVVRGEAEVERLREIGVRFSQSETKFELFEPGGLPTLAPELSDLAVGILAYWAKGGDEAQQWARVILGASGMIDLVALEDSEIGDQLLEAIWTLSEGAPIPDETIEVLRSHAA